MQTTTFLPHKEFRTQRQLLGELYLLCVSRPKFHHYYWGGAPPPNHSWNKFLPHIWIREKGQCSLWRRDLMFFKTFLWLLKVASYNLLMHRIRHMLFFLLISLKILSRMLRCTQKSPLITFMVRKCALNHDWVWF